MSMSFDKILGVHEKALNVHAKRVELLAGNLANADTPNFKARDIDFRAALSDANAQLSASPVKRTHAGHQAGAAVSTGGSTPLYRNPLQSSLDGNTVDVQTERGEFAQAAFRYQAALQFVDSKLRGIVAALKGE